MTNKENLQYTSMIRALYLLGQGDLADTILEGDEATIAQTLSALKAQQKQPSQE